MVKKILNFFLDPLFRDVRFWAVAILSLPLFMWLAWQLTPKRKLVTAVIDKTVLTKEGQEHISLNWVLNQERFTKNNSELYKGESDYFGFFPYADEKYRIRGLERFSEQQLTQLSKDCKAVYLTDAYGIYRNEWYKHKNINERSGIIYGGMSENDLVLLKKMKAQKKLIITEFNCLATPTQTVIRDEFEKNFGVRWTGWVGRYFDSFDTSRNKELPRWLIRNYMRQNNYKWPFKKPGIAFVNITDEVVILEEGTHLNIPYPKIISTIGAREQFGVPQKLRYSFWFDVVQSNADMNKVESVYEIYTNANGQKELTRRGLSRKFPAVISHRGTDYTFYYFAGDFSDNPIKLRSSYFKGVGFFKWMMYNRVDANNRESFFWNYYRPMVTTILNEYYDRVD